jgi:hypothetical protein
MPWNFAKDLVPMRLRSVETQKPPVAARVLVMHGHIWYMFEQKLALASMSMKNVLLVGSMPRLSNSSIDCSSRLICEVVAAVLLSISARRCPRSCEHVFFILMGCGQVKAFLQHFVRIPTMYSLRRDWGRPWS